ncbi:DHS-like NAD/FAD-binding domain-containing protein [Coprinopsis sp. MPI-PUGE-AT-0042]|nr:DHS-like NAD/FAD-binding domain-containing protein [Coprinopsis sp. MPI-PUGE-AT-0042]
MRVSVPHIPQAILSAKPAFPQISREEAITKLSDFVKSGNLTVLTGAGVSVDSGIRAYRGPDGRYMNPNYKPIFYHELIDESEKGRYFRQRYWLRSYLGYPPVRDAKPNTTHFALASMMHSGHVPRVITQNVDGLHHKALRQGARSLWPEDRIKQTILELHGTLHRVHCRRGHSVDRNTFQDMLGLANPRWQAFAEEMEKTNSQLRTNPDGDVAIEHLGVTYQDFVVPDCPSCAASGHRNSVHKPEVIFFGETIPPEVKDRSFGDIEDGDKLLLIGTTLATYSAFRLVKHALELKKPVMLLNMGPTRADALPGIEKIDTNAGEILTDVARAALGTRINTDSVLQGMLRSGIVKPPETDDDRAPRAAG